MINKISENNLKYSPNKGNLPLFTKNDTNNYMIDMDDFAINKKNLIVKSSPQSHKRDNINIIRDK